jgi:class 3 adenylate cyclase
MEFTVRGPITTTEAAWTLIGDTDKLARLAGSPSVQMRIERDATDYPEVRGTFVGPAFLRHPFVEPDSRWVHHRWFEQVRDIGGPLMKRMVYRARLEAAEGGVIPHIDFSVDFMNPVASLLGRANVVATERAWRKAVALLPSPESLRVVGPPLRTLPPVLEGALGAWEQREVQPELVHRVRDHLLSVRAPELNRLRPFELADAWGLSRDDVLVGFLEGVLAGALELVWVSRCPRCTAGVSTVSSLSDLADHAECVSCRIGFSPSLDRDVEVVFAAHPAIRPPPGEAFCTLYPVDRPEVRAMLTVAPHASETVEVPIPPGIWYLGSGGERPDQRIVVRGRGAHSHHWTPDQHEPVEVAAGDVALTLENPTDGRLRVQLAGTPDQAAVVSAARLATYPAYRSLFGPQALAADVRLTVRAVTILFTDLSGSAALYDAHGDATAFSLVHAHFQILDEVVAACGGTRVKTIGDALMAAFSDPSLAVRAALQMQRKFGEWAATLDLKTPPGLKVGIHFGPAMAVHTDQAGLDWFGGTVNLAARCEGQATAGDVVWTAAVHNAPGVSAVIEEEAAVIVPFNAKVKGISGTVSMVRALPGPESQSSQ